MSDYLKADSGWVLYRLASHAAVLIAMLAVFYFVTGSWYLFVGVSLVIAALYSVIVFAHARLPLMSFHSDHFVFRDYFYKGRRVISLLDIECIEITKSEIKLFGSGEAMLSTKGMRREYLLKFRNELAIQAIKHGLEVRSKVYG